MVVDDFDVLGPGLRPPEADPVMIVDPDRMLPDAVTLELLEPQAWK